MRAETLNLFVEKFKDYGFKSNSFYPCYGMAEATLLVSGGDKKSDPVVKWVQTKALAENKIVDVTPNSPGSKAIIGCGKSCLNTKIIIVDPESFQICIDGKVGEIWVSSPSVAQGYWHSPQQTQDTFDAYLKDNAETFLRTGDLGFLSDGELFVTGRLKDMMIIRGNNYYPQDIELTVENSHPFLKTNCSAAFSMESEGQEHLVIVCEIERTRLRNLNIDEIVGAIQIALSTENNLEADKIVLLKTGTIPKTSSGKIQRHACKQGWLENSLNIVGQWQKSLEYNIEIDAITAPFTTDKIQDWLTQLLSKELGINIDTIESKIDFEHYGMNSMIAVSIAQQIENVLEVSISSLDLMQNANLEKLAKFIVCQINNQTREIIEI